METSKSSKAPIIIAAVVLLLGAGAAVYALSTGNEMNETNETAKESTQTAEEMGMTEEEHANMDKASESSSATAGTVITFTNDGFDKSEYTSKTGEKVTVKNESDMSVQFSSDDHPTHREHPELNMKTLKAGESGTFTPPGAGTYDFHDHINDQYTGTLVVK